MGLTVAGPVKYAVGGGTVETVTVWDEETGIAATVTNGSSVTAQVAFPSLGISQGERDRITQALLDRGLEVLGIMPSPSPPVSTVEQALSSLKAFRGALDPPLGLVIGCLTRAQQMDLPHSSLGEGAQRDVAAVRRYLDLVVNGAQEDPEGEALRSLAAETLQALTAWIAEE